MVRKVIQMPAGVVVEAVPAQGTKLAMLPPGRHARGH